jgi:hypothetical protein
MLLHNVAISARFTGQVEDVFGAICSVVISLISLMVSLRGSCDLEKNITTCWPLVDNTWSPEQTVAHYRNAGKDFEI